MRYKYMTMVSDGDAKSFTAVQKLAPYGDVAIKSRRRNALTTWQRGCRLHCGIWLTPRIREVFGSVGQQRAA